MQKITSAMEKVAAGKIRKAQRQMEESRPYAQRIRRVIGHLAYANPDYKHPFLIERDAKRVGLIVISTDRGLCGGLNANLFKTVIGELARWKEEGVEVDLVVPHHPLRLLQHPKGPSGVEEVAHRLPSRPTLSSAA